MRVVGRVACWTAVILLVLAAISWAGIMVVAPHYFLVPAIALALLIGFLAIVVGSHKKSVARSSVNRSE